MRSKRNLFAIYAVVRLVLWPSAAFAHPMQGVGDFYAGMLHPVTALETVLPILALGLLAGQQNRENAVRLLFIFPAALFIGAALASFHPSPSALGLAQVGFAAVLGGLVALARPLPKWLVIGLGSVLGIAAGWSNTGEITGDVSRFRFVAGLTIAGFLLVTHGVGLVRRLTVAWSQIAVRVVGSWIAATGILVLGLK
ncbi:MAG TPA: HupE/UreJ family protein [Terriglobales bacterium]|nr:HupE/UreJ family protein [Terriglobales bacterium]